MKILLPFRFLSLFLFLSLFFVFPASPAYARQGCCSWHGGVCGCKCCDGTSLSAKCAPYYPSCKPSPPPCAPNCACASSTCSGQTCSNGCGGVCSGTLDCTPRVQEAPEEPVKEPEPEPEPEPVQEETTEVQQEVQEEQILGDVNENQQKEGKASAEDTTCSSIFLVGGISGISGIFAALKKKKLIGL